MGKIAIVCGSLSRGGAERVTVNLLEYLYKIGKDVMLITGAKKENEYQLSAEIKRIVLNDAVDGKLRICKMIQSMRKCLSEEKIDTVIIMGVPVCLYAVPPCIGRPVKMIVSERNDPKHFEGKTVVKILSRLLMSMAHGYVFQTQEAMDFYPSKYAAKGKIIRNPLIIESVPQRISIEKRIVTCGRLVEQKNQKLLIDAFDIVHQKYPDYKLVIYGEGPLRNRLTEYIVHKKLLEAVEMPGNVTNVLEKIVDTTVFVLSSDFEGMPNALIEAMAIGVPCISTDCPCGGPRELIINGQNGLLTEVGNTEQLAGAIIRMIEDEEFREDIAKVAMQVKRSLAIECIGGQWLDLIDRVSLPGNRVK